MIVLLLTFLFFVTILPIWLFYWRIKKMDLDAQQKPFKKIIDILNTNQLFLAAVLYTIIGIIVYFITKN